MSSRMCALNTTPSKQASPWRTGKGSQFFLTKPKYFCIEIHGLVEGGCLGSAVKVASSAQVNARMKARTDSTARMAARLWALELRAGASGA